LIIGASGGVGSYAVQLAKHLGANVTGVTSSANLDLVQSLGAHRVVDYTTGDITELPERYDLIVQLAGAHRAGQLRPLLTQDGTLLQLSGDSKNEWVGPMGRIIGGRLGAMRTRQTVTTFTVQPNRDDLTYLADLLAAGTLQTHIDRSFSIDDVLAAIERVESGRPRGKVTIRVAAAFDKSPATPSASRTWSPARSRLE
jgi:NADPH:quinone reductase-like Zn-dependent oxidoreductase